MTNKIFITGPHCINKLDIANKIVEKNEDLSIGNRFTNDKQYINESKDNYIYYLSTQSIDLTYKNNFVLFVNTDNYISTGITMDSYYNNDIFVMELEEFNNISNIIFKSDSTDILVVWVDANYDKTDENLKSDADESMFLEQRLMNDNIKYLYFFNDDNDTICDTILEYIDADEEKRNEILENNS